jgi:hypothetical protein
MNTRAVSDAARLVEATEGLGAQVQIPSARLCDVARHRNTPNPRFRGIFLFLALVILCGAAG